MKQVGVGPDGYSEIGLEISNFDGFVDGDDVFSLMAELNEDERLP